ncbi:homoserine dehydrogenase family protein [Winogradskyella aquimaris]|uniref:Homoserine dehydrogenase n=1 Tax=Winogradskyella aquimaris TaxID=864074 RepID=A0ABU5EM44_9FLAO|nr:aspartate kinase [Winogradskyella aquimaris]MDY2585752.1 aspartate kinase [Winogradskyella aquimaris]
MTTIHLAVFGIGNVGSTLIHQIQKIKSELLKSQHIAIKIPVIANSTLAFFANDNEMNWKLDFEKFSEPYTIEDVIYHFATLNVEHAIAVDVTASNHFIAHYETLIKNGFHIVAANKVANTLDYNFYKRLRNVLKANNKEFLYETNVGAGLPIIETIKGLLQSGEQITKIKGVFSGSLSYIFNQFSEGELPFHQVLNNAVNQGLTEPDPRDDLSGKDVARKLLILARELGINVELSDVKIQPLVPKHLNGSATLQQFNVQTHQLNDVFSAQKLKLKNESVLRYVGWLDTAGNTLEVKLISEPKASPLGQLKGTDNLFEIYTETYKEQPLVIQGAGAGKVVTARGVLSDIIKLSRHLQKINVGKFV